MASNKTADKDAKEPRTRDAKSSRRATGVNVSIAVAAATALLILVNILAGEIRTRRDVQTMGRYGLSQTALAILDEIDQPVHLTSIYTATAADMDPDKYLPQVRDVLDELAERNDKVAVTNVTSDRQKAELLARLRKRLDAMATDEVAVLRDFQRFSEAQAPRYEQLARTWQRYPASGWLSQFGTPKQIEQALDDSREALDDAAQAIRTALGGATLPDYVTMTGQVTEALKALKRQVAQITGNLSELENVPRAVSQSSVELVASAKAATAAWDEMLKTVEGAPADPGAALDKLAAASDKAATAAGEVQGRLDALSQASRFVSTSANWRLAGRPLPDRYAWLAGAAADLGAIVKSYREALKVEKQKQAIEQLKQQLADLKARATDLEQGVAEMVRSLSSMDTETDRILKEAKKPDSFPKLVEELDVLLAKADPQPPSEDDKTAWEAYAARQERRRRLEGQKELIERIREDNIVVVEVGDKTGVVTFDEVWPPASTPFGDPSRQKQDKRNFYGDMAVAGKMLALTAEPFGEVVLTFFENIPPRQQWQFNPPTAGPVWIEDLTVLRDRLEDGNLKVVEWNLFDAPEPPAPTIKDAPRVLLVLPPPPAMGPNPMMPQQRPEWTDQHTDSVRRVIESGTPAIFLAGFMRDRPMSPFGPPPGPSYVLGDYFRTDWGLDVRNNTMVVRGVPEKNDPGAVKLDAWALRWLPLSNFTDHPIGRPLQAQRMLWQGVCPITPIEDSKVDATVQPVLHVPESDRTTWATADIEKLVTKMYVSRERIAPAGEAEDLKPPFPVVVDARKTVDGNLARVVIVGTYVSFVDAYLNEDVMRLEGEGALTFEPPPASNADLIVNSAYYLIAKTQYIGAGPSVNKPIGLIPEATRNMLWVVFGVLPPVLVLSAALAVWVVRKR